MFNDTPARKPISYWVSEQGRCMKWFSVLGYLRSKCVFGLIVNININISGPPTLFVKSMYVCKRMNECLPTPQPKIQIGYWVSDKW